MASCPKCGGEHGQEGSPSGEPDTLGAHKHCLTAQVEQVGDPKLRVVWQAVLAGLTRQRDEALRRAWAPRTPEDDG